VTTPAEIQTNWNLIGHAWAVNALARNIAADHVAHAYLFTGPHAIGKTSLARALAQTLECANANAPCGQCAHCLKIARDRHPDVQVIDGVPPGFKIDEKSPPIPPRVNDWERRILKIDQIRAIQHDVARAPFEGRWKIIIVRRFEEANEEAANAFLKTLEEPPRHTRLILTARDASLLLPTIASRCQVFPLRPLSSEQIEQALIERWRVNPESARLLAHVACGRLGWAVRAATNPALLESRRAHLDLLAAVLREGTAERIARAEGLAKKSDELPELLEAWLGWWRDVLLAQTQDDSAKIINIDRLNHLTDQAQKFSLDQIESALKACQATARYLSQNINARLALEVMLINFPG